MEFVKKNLNFFIPSLNGNLQVLLFPAACQFEVLQLSPRQLLCLHFPSTWTTEDLHQQQKLQGFPKHEQCRRFHLKEKLLKIKLIKNLSLTNIKQLKSLLQIVSIKKVNRISHQVQNFELFVVPKKLLVDVAHFIFIQSQFH